MRYLIDKAVKVIVELYNPDEILLFGSYAKEKETLESDIDLLIIKETSLPRHNRGWEVVEFLKRYPQKFDLLFYTPLEVLEAKQKPFSFLQSILISGIFVYKKF